MSDNHEPILIYDRYTDDGKGIGPTHIYVRSCGSFLEWHPDGMLTGVPETTGQFNARLNWAHEQNKNKPQEFTEAERALFGGIDQVIAKIRRENNNP